MSVISGNVLRLLALALGLLLTAGGGIADPVGITAGELRRVIDLGPRTIVIERDQDPGATIPPEFARTARACPPFCIVPMQAAPGIETVGELELLAFLESRVAQGQGLLVDSRLPEFYQRGIIPGAINLPFSALDRSNPYRDAILEALGAVPAASGWDFAQAQELMVYCGGPWCDQAPRALRALLESGYPPDRLRYYRGGLQDWVMLGLTVATPPAVN